MIRSIALLCVAAAFAALSQPAHAEGEKELATYPWLGYAVVREDGKAVVVPVTAPKASSRPLWLWDPVTDKRTKILPKGLAEADIVYAMPSANGKTFLVRSRSENSKFTTLTLFDVESGKELGSAKGEGNLLPEPYCTALTPDGTRLACRRNNKVDGIILLLDLKTGKSEEIATKDGDFARPTFSADGEYLAATTWGRHKTTGPFSDGITVWETKTWKVTREFRVDTEDMELFAISPDAKTLVAIGSPLTGKEWNLRMWSLETGKQVWNLSRIQQTPRDPSPLGGLAFGKKGEIVAVGTPGAVLILDASTGKETASVKLPHAEKLGSPGRIGPVTAHRLSLSPDGKLLAVTFEYGMHTKIYDISELKK